ncbi:MAG: efflux RND transporter periplasmic adaptor subunit [Pseudomonadota bacterium]
MTKKPHKQSSDFSRQVRKNLLLILGIVFLFLTAVIITKIPEKDIYTGQAPIIVASATMTAPAVSKVKEEPIIIAQAAPTPTATTTSTPQERTQPPPEVTATPPQPITEPPPQLQRSRSNINIDENSLTVQAVLASTEKIVIASGLDAKIIKLDKQSGDTFKKGEALVRYDCSVDRARLKEMESRQRVTEKQLKAFEKLKELDSASEIELLVAKENNEQNKALISQIKGRLQACQHIAPWNGRIIQKMASEYEYVQNGRVIMEIASLKPLRAEFLIPSKWLQWLNIGTPLALSINETGRQYNAKIEAIYGEVDPVSQTIQVAAEIDKYHEELLPGMSGRVIFSEGVARSSSNKGFIGLQLSSDSNEG